MEEQIPENDKGSQEDISGSQGQATEETSPEDALQEENTTVIDENDESEIQGQTTEEISSEHAENNVVVDENEESGSQVECTEEISPDDAVQVEKSNDVEEGAPSKVLLQAIEELAISPESNVSPPNIRNSVSSPSKQALPRSSMRVSIDSVTSRRSTRTAASSSSRSSFTESENTQVSMDSMVDMVLRKSTTTFSQVTSSRPSLVEAQSTPKTSRPRGFSRPSRQWASVFHAPDSTTDSSRRPTLIDESEISDDIMSVITWVEEGESEVTRNWKLPPAGSRLAHGKRPPGFFLALKNDVVAAQEQRQRHEARERAIKRQQARAHRQQERHVQDVTQRRHVKAKAWRRKCLETNARVQRRVRHLELQRHRQARALSRRQYEDYQQRVRTEKRLQREQRIRRFEEQALYQWLIRI